jgi:hypothetical protein
LRPAGAATLAEGNALLPAFMADYNARFAKAPANNKDLHRPLRAGDDLDDTFAWKEEGTLSRALTLQYDKVMFILEPSEQAKAAIGKRVTVVDYPDSRLAIRYRGVELAYRTSTKFARSRRPRSSRTNSLAPRSPSSAKSSCVARLSVAVGRAGAISTTRVSLKSAELFYEPSGPSPLGKTGAVSDVGTASAGRALRYAGGSAPAPSRGDFSSVTGVGWSIALSLILSPGSFFCPGSAPGHHLMGSDQEQVGQSKNAQWWGPAEKSST